MTVTMGPKQSPQEAARLRAQYERMQGVATASGPSVAQLCNCMGPQPGETKCPCMLAAEMRTANDMLTDGVVIAGRKYRLVPDA